MTTLRWRTAQSRNRLIGGPFFPNSLNLESAGTEFNFLNMTYVNKSPSLGFQYGDPNNFLTYTSPSNKYVRNAAGVYVAGTTLRTDYLANGTALGLLVEGQRTNIALRSGELGNASWGKTNLTVTDNAAVAPDGTATAEKLVATSASGIHIIYQDLTVTANTQYVASFFVKAAEYSKGIIFWAKTDNSSGGNANFDLAVGTIGSANVYGTGASYSTGIESAGSGWYRVWITGVADAASTTLRTRISLVDNSSASTFTGNDVNGIYAWGGQVEVGTFVSSPIVTTSAAVTRGSDDITILTSLLPFDATKGTLLAKIRPNATTSSFYAMLDNNSTNNRIGLRTATGLGQVFISDGGVGQAALNNGATAANTVSKVAASWKANDIAISVNGAAATADTSATIPTVDRLRLGASVGSSYLEGWLQQLIYLPRDMSDSELVAWSTL